MLEITLSINGRVIAAANALNVTPEHIVSDDAPLSVYEVTAVTKPMGDGETDKRAFRVEGHRREDGPWPLVERIARELAGN